MARFDVRARRRGEKDRQILDVDAFGASEDRRIRRALRQECDVVIIDTNATTDPRARYTILLVARADPDPTPSEE